MAQHKVGNRILDEEEYAIESVSIWAFYLFIIGALIGGAFMLDTIPEDWQKELRYAAVVAGGIGAGGLLGALAVHIRHLFYIGLFLGGVSGVLYWTWTPV